MTPSKLFNAKLYDQAHQLSSQETTHIANFINTGDKAKRYKTLFRNCPRLTQPILDALAILACPEISYQHAIIVVILRSMHASASSFWAWTEQDWHHLLDSLSNHDSPYVVKTIKLYCVGIAYLLGGIHEFAAVSSTKFKWLAYRLFGVNTYENALKTISNELMRQGYKTDERLYRIPNILAQIFLRNSSSELSAIRVEDLETFHETAILASHKFAIRKLSYALFGLGIIQRRITIAKLPTRPPVTFDPIHPEWQESVQKWFETSTLTKNTRIAVRGNLLRIGRLLFAKYPEIVAPAQITSHLALTLMTHVDKMQMGEWVLDKHFTGSDKELAANSKLHIIYALRRFFGDIQEWEWIPKIFEPTIRFGHPQALLSVIGPNPRNISEDIWDKLVQAGLDLSVDDIPKNSMNPAVMYPFEMIRAIALIWLFAGLRQDEIKRLEVGCIRWPDISTDSRNDDDNQICLLQVPTNKTTASFWKPVSSTVGVAINEWERLRPFLPPFADRKTGELVHYLFSFHNKNLGDDYINLVIIPMLCRKAEIDNGDGRGRYTSHRGRATIATLLANSDQHMPIQLLMHWLGHRSADSTLHYARVLPYKQSKAYANASLLKSNLREIDVLLDQKAIRSGRTAKGEDWRFYDLGHGYCTYDFFDKCPHRMACAKCSFYRPHEELQAQFLEGKRNLVRLRQSLELGVEELKAIDGDIDAFESILQNLSQVPAPDGTISDITTKDIVPTSFIPLSSININHNL